MGRVERPTIMGRRVALEVCVDCMESAMAAARGGAARIELCSDLIEGGVTPSAGLIRTILSRVWLGVFVMIRPRAGDFCYSADEFEIMEQDVLTAKQLGADGVVFGILNQNGEVDEVRTRRLVAIARPLKVTFHRAFDLSRNLRQSLETLIAAGVDRILTSGGEQNASEGARMIRELVEAAGDRVTMMAGAGITDRNVRSLLRETGVREIHASISASVSGPMRYRNRKVSLSRVKNREYHRDIVLESRVRRLLVVASDEKAQSAHSNA
jgi:copper homeostasis protein